MSPHPPPEPVDRSVARASPYSCQKECGQSGSLGFAGLEMGLLMWGPIFWLVLAVVSIGLGGYALVVGLYTLGGPDILRWFPLGAAVGLGFLGFSCVRQAIELTRRPF
jgi:hypothetical protein